MAGDSSEQRTRHKHHRSSGHDDADDNSKRRKHRHHRRHRSKKDVKETKETVVAEEELRDVDQSKLENEEDGDSDAVGEVLVSTSAVVNYDMEEGEIVDDDRCLANTKKNLHSDVESGEIELNGCNDSNMGLNDEHGERAEIKSIKLGKDGVVADEGGNINHERAPGFKNLANCDSADRCDVNDAELAFGDSNRTYRFDEVRGRTQTKSLSSEKSHRAIKHSRLRDKYVEESPKINLSKSPESSRGRRSRSQSILQDVHLPNKMEDLYYLERKRTRESSDERTMAHDRSYGYSSRDGARYSDREHSSSRYTDKMERHYVKNNHERYRENSSESDQIRDIIVEKERDEPEEKERLRDRDRRERDRDRGVLKGREKKKEREKDRQRERGRGGERDQLRDIRNIDMERGGGRAGSRDNVIVSGRSSRGQEYDHDGDGYRDRDKDFRERGRERDRVREIRNNDRERGGGRARSRDNDNITDRLIRSREYDCDEDSYRDRDEDFMRRRNFDDHHKERLRRTGLENANSQDNLDMKDNVNSNSDVDIQKDYQEKIALQLAKHEDDDVEKIKEESRRRKQAILEKYKNQQQKSGTQLHDLVKEKVEQSTEQVSSTEVIINNIDSEVEGEGTDFFVDKSTFSVGKSPSQDNLSVFERPNRTGGLGEGTPKSERSGDMLSDDIFGESPTGDRKMGKGDGAAVEKSGLHDNWDDAEGYYGYRFGETLNDRYEIVAAHGKGVFSTVVRAKDLKAKPGHPEEVAIKIIRNNDTMYKAGMEERIILKKLVAADPENKRHCIRFLSTFKYRNHLCLVFESLNMNLRDVLKKFGRNIGLKLTAVRTYAKQLFVALKHLKNCGVLHCDIKPDNMLVNEAKTVLKLCDFGNAMFAGKNEITPYLVSRFYRAPEIILGLPYDHPMDIWSVGCCLFELYTGKVLFPGSTNNDMLRLHMELKGPFPKKMLRKGAFTEQHFDQDLNFLATEEDPVTKKEIRRLTLNIKPKDFGTLISGSSVEDPKMVANFKDLMEKIFVLDPEKRLNVSQTLSHPFITGK